MLIINNNDIIIGIKGKLATVSTADKRAFLLQEGYQAKHAPDLKEKKR